MSAVVAAVESFDGTRAEWRRSRAAVARAAGLRFFRSAWAAGRLAPFALAHWGLETGEGAHEVSGNLGNIRAFANWRGLVCVRNGLLWRAYETPVDGAEDYLRLLWSKVPGAVSRYLVDVDGPALFRALIATGYTPPSDHLFATFDALFTQRTTIATV